MYEPPPPLGSEENPGTCCKDILDNRVWQGAPTSGTFWVKPPGYSSQKIFCDQETEGGGWNMVVKSCLQYTDGGGKYRGWGSHQGDNKYNQNDISEWACDGEKGGKLADGHINNLWTASEAFGSGHGDDLMCKSVKDNQWVWTTNANGGNFVWKIDGYSFTSGTTRASDKGGTRSTSYPNNNYFGWWTADSQSGCSCWSGDGDPMGCTTRTNGRNWESDEHTHYLIR